MAALLCKPCEWINDCLNGCCKTCNEACNGVCNECTACIGAFFCAPEMPSPVFLTFTTCLALPLALVSLVTVSDETYGDRCDKPLHIYLYIALILCICHIIFACYLFRLVGQLVKEKQADTENQNQHQSVWDRACHIFQWDPCVAAYILIFIFNFIWSIMLIEGGDDKICKNTDLAKKCKDVGDWLLVYSIFTPLVLSLSVCVQAGRESESSCCCIDCFIGTPSQRKASRERAQAQRQPAGQQMGQPMNAPGAYAAQPAPPVVTYAQPSQPPPPPAASAPPQPPPPAGQPPPPVGQPPPPPGPPPTYEDPFHRGEATAQRYRNMLPSFKSPW